MRDAASPSALRRRTALFQYGGPRLSERPGTSVGSPSAEIFAHEHGTKLDVVGFGRDSLVRPEEEEALYEYLTGEAPCDDDFAVVPGEDAVHGMVISNPGGLIDVLDDHDMLP